MFINAYNTCVLLYDHVHRLGKGIDTFIHFGSHLYPREQVWNYYFVHHMIYVTLLFSIPLYGPSVAEVTRGILTNTLYVEHILLGYYTPNGVCLIYCSMFHSYFTFRKYINTSASFQPLDTPLKYLNTPCLARSYQFNGDMLNCRLKGSLVLVCLACIWRSTDHYGKVRYYLSQVNLSSYNFYDFFTFIFFGFS